MVVIPPRLRLVGQERFDRDGDRVFLFDLPGDGLADDLHGVGLWRLQPAVVPDPNDLSGGKSRCGQDHHYGRRQQDPDQDAGSPFLLFRGKMSARDAGLLNIIVVRLIQRL